MNTSIKVIANLMSNFIARKLDCLREDIVLSDNMKINIVGRNICTGGNLYADEEWSKVFIIDRGWNIRKITPTVREEMAGQNANGTWEDSLSHNDKVVAESITENDLFIVFDVGSDYEAYDRHERERTVIVQKVDLKKVGEFVDSANKAEVKRWAEWLTK